MPPRRPVLSLAILLALVASACQATRRVTLSTGLAPAQRAEVLSFVKAGDRVRLRTADGQVHAITVAAVKPDALVAGDGRRFALREIASLERKALAKGRTIALITVVGLAVLFVVVLANAPLLAVASP
jgi:hypothetical protein